MKEFTVKAYVSPEHNWWFHPHPAPPCNTRTKTPRFWIPAGNKQREECRPFIKYARILNDLSPCDWEQLGLDKVLTTSPLANVQLPELCCPKLPRVHELSAASVPPCAVGGVHGGAELPDDQLSVEPPAVIPTITPPKVPAPPLLLQGRKLCLWCQSEWPKNTGGGGMNAGGSRCWSCATRADMSEINDSGPGPMICKSPTTCNLCCQCLYLVDPPAFSGEKPCQVRLPPHQ